MSANSYVEFFERVTEHVPYPYQRRLGEESWPELLNIPTGLGKTAGVVVSWLWKRLQDDSGTPRRLVYCLPMRVLVEQTTENAHEWIRRAAPAFDAEGKQAPQAHVLMGGELDEDWVANPEDPAILVGTQDMLLSRALMRGYGMSRYAWPVHFSLLHNDALWVLDEVQLMGPGLTTSAQLEAFRRAFPLAKRSRTIWVSATLNRNWLATVDFRSHLDEVSQTELSDEDREEEAVVQRTGAAKQLAGGRSRVGSAVGSQKGRKAYAEVLAGELLERHRPGHTTLVILNTVARAQAVFQALAERKKDEPSPELLLIHSRFRPPDREEIEATLKTAVGDGGRIVVATQAVEAGVDLTSAVLFTELAPWSSMVQRFGRCNRYGELSDAEVFWIDVDTEERPDLAAPYEPDALDRARERLDGLETVSPGSLPATEEEAPLVQVLRRKDFVELFNTDPDLSGFDVDVSPFIRDVDETDLQVFWRNLDEEGLEGQHRPGRAELCRVSIRGFEKYLKRIRRKTKDDPVYVWDALADRWLRFRERARPGLTLMLDAKFGGYDPQRGFRPKAKGPVPVVPSATDDDPASYSGDPETLGRPFVELSDHLLETEGEAQDLCRTIGETQFRDAVCRAARWHDVGKSHPVFQKTLTGCDDGEGRSETLWAKSPCRGRHARPYFRHELASMVAWITQHEDNAHRDLIAYLIAAHHGKVRTGIRALPTEKEPDDIERRFARGVWEGDELPGLTIGEEEEVAPVVIRLGLMELGRGSQGPSWTARTQELLAELGPFRLAWLETLVRVADWRASAIAERKVAEGELDGV